MNSFMVYFDFTTVHGNKFVGRSGQVALETEFTKEQVCSDTENVTTVCARYILSQKPKWKILMLDVKEVTQLPNQSKPQP